MQCLYCNQCSLNLQGNNSIQRFQVVMHLYDLVVKQKLHCFAFVTLQRPNIMFCHVLHRNINLPCFALERYSKFELKKQQYLFNFTCYTSLGFGAFQLSNTSSTFKSGIASTFRSGKDYWSPKFVKYGFQHRQDGHVSSQLQLCSWFRMRKSCQKVMVARYAINISV